MSKDITMDEVCELYGNNEERLVAVARALGVLADGWYMAAAGMAEKFAGVENAAYLLSQVVASPPRAVSE